MKTLKLLLVVMLILSLNTGQIMASDNSNFITENEFLDLIENTETFLNFENIMYDGNYETLVEIKDITEQAYGRMARIEVEYNLDSSSEVSIMSYLVFIYEYETGKLTELLVDNSLLYEDGIINIIDFEDNSIDTHDLSNDEFYHEYINTINQDLQENELSSITESDIDNNRYLCFRCTQYESSNHDLSDSCMSAFSWVCGAIGIKTGLPGFLICAGAAVVSCWVPAYRICVDGEWSTTCPLYD